MTPQLKEKLSKIYELLKRGSEGERQAAQTTLDRMVKKYNLEGIDFSKLNKEKYKFKYVSLMEAKLLHLIVILMTDNGEEISDSAIRYVGDIKEIQLELEYIDYVTISCAYEYFRWHMKEEWARLCLPAIKKTRKANRKKKRDELSQLFFEQYAIASGLYRPDWLQEINPGDLTKKDLKNHAQLNGMQGGKYNTQVQNGLMLEAGNNGA